MNKPYFIELTNKLYRLTFFFPQREPLRHRIRELGDEILTNLVLILEGEIEKRREAAFSVEKNIEILDSLLELSKSQNWIDSEQIKKIQSKYSEIKVEVEEFNDILRRKSAFYESKALMIEDAKKKEKEAIQREKEQKEEEKKESSEFITKKEEKKQTKEKESVELNSRQEKIVDLLRKREKIQVKDIQEFLPKTTKRTLRRDLSYLVQKNMAKRFGKGNTTYYSQKEKVLNRT